MKIHPSIHGFYFKNYLYFTILSVVLFIAALYIELRTGEYGVSLLITAIAVFLIAIGVFHSVVNSKTTYLEITENELIYDSGILSHKRVSAPISRITDIKMQRTFFERITKIADLLVNTSGTASVEINAECFEYEDVSKIHAEITDAINKEDRKRHVGIKS